MRYIQTAVYTAIELKDIHPSSYDRAYNWYISNIEIDFITSDILHSLGRCLEFIDVEIKDYQIDAGNSAYSYVKFKHEHPNIKGVRLFKYLQNKYYSLPNPGFMPSGYYTDCMFFEPFRDFLKRPDIYTQIDHLIQQGIESVLKAIEDEFEYQASEEIFIETAEINQWEFLADGTLV